MAMFDVISLSFLSLAGVVTAEDAPMEPLTTIAASQRLQYTDLVCSTV